MGFELRQHARRCWLIGLGVWWSLAIGTLSGAEAVPQKSGGFQEWQLYDLHSGNQVSFEEVKPLLLAADVIYVGEEHYNPAHIQIANRVIESLIAGGKRPALAMEMFGWDGQAGLDGYIRGDIGTTEQFLQESHWESNWGGEFADYQPLVALAKHHQLQLYGLNPPRTLVRKVASKGLVAASQDPEMVEWGLDQAISSDDPDYHRVIYEQIEQCHPGLSPDVYQRIYEASIFRDEGMAKVIADFLRQRSGAGEPLVSYTGGGHVQYHVPIPNRVKRDSPVSIKQVTLYLMALDPTHEEDIPNAIDSKIADYIWLTPLGPRGPQPRCG